MATDTKAMEYTQQTLGNPVPLCYGLVRARGVQLGPFNYSDKTRLAFYLLGEGEWDGIDRMWINRKRVDPTNTSLVHFHPGIDGVIGAGLTPVSIGGDQNVDLWFADLPNSVQRCTYSRKAYVAVKVPPDPGAPTADLEVLADYRTKKVRIYDASGNQTGYLYTPNGAWCVLDALISRLVKPEAMVNEALTAAELARFDFPSFSDFAARCDADIGGFKRFEVNVAFPQACTLTAVLERLLLMTRGYLIESAGKICLRSDKSRAYSFLLSASHIAAGPIPFNKQDVRGSANRFAGHFNDINPPHIVNILTVTRAGNVVTCDTDGNHNLHVGDQVLAAGIDDASFNGGPFVVATAPLATRLTWAQTAANASSAHGYLGMDESRFQERTPQEDHDNHAYAIGQRGLNLQALPKRVTLDVDLGNNIAKRVANILWYLKTRNLGVDQSGWKAPWQGTITAWLESVDVNGNALIAQQPGDTLRFDRSLSEELANRDFEIIETAPSEGKIELLLKEYIDAAFTDTAPDPGDVSVPPPGIGLISSRGPANFSYKPTSDPLTATDAGSSTTINIAAFTMQIAGMGTINYNSGAITGVGYGVIKWVVVDDADLRGGAASYALCNSKAEALGKVGWLCLGSIVTPKKGKGDTRGNNDGGATAQTGMVMVYTPGAYACSALWSSPGNAIDKDSNSYAECVGTGGATEDFDCFQFPALVVTGFTSLVLKIKHQVTGRVSGTAFVKYSLDDGVTWATLRTINAVDASPVTSQVSLDLAQLLTKVRTRFELPPGASSTATSYAGTAADDASIGSRAWANATSAQGAANNTWAIAGGGMLSIAYSHYLKLTNFGFALPSTAIIAGVKVEVTREDQGSVDYTTGVVDNAVRLVKGGVIGAVDRSNGSNWALTPETVAYGGGSDMWGLSLTYADVNNAGFGVAISAEIDNDITNGNYAEAAIDAVRITVSYSTSGAGNSGRVYEVSAEAQF